jgi:hypothetical protein
MVKDEYAYRGGHRDYILMDCVLETVLGKTGRSILSKLVQ